eukprot:CAMPEP_0198720978 /NCGR_PEP_ID=MMETSP1471-20131121/64646_1 /TAXON_ID=41880 /ORGANISM="Pycnococcus provasolii, Strain RCC733" /LENGTH=263 /DNA_ID=CAMNT_0044481853 /DNA_START=1089 /DNA_END=1881 /DNA_ORIENTATION=+
MPGLHLNAFRGEPAISGFAWHFTATHSSSGSFATDPGSALHRRVPPASAWPWVDHPVSGRSARTHRPFGLAFAPAPPVPGLASLARLTRRLILQKAAVTPSLNRGGSDRPEAQGFRIYFTPLTGVLFTVPSRYWFTIGRWRYLALGGGPPCFPPDLLFTVPSRYWFTIGRWRYLALGGGPPCFPPDFSCPAVLTIRNHTRCQRLAYGILTLFDGPFQWPSALSTTQCEGSTAPSTTLVQPSYGSASQLVRRISLGSSPFARRY